MIKKKIQPAISDFEKAQKLFPGTKRGLNTEFDNFVYRCKHPLTGQRKLLIVDVLPLLLPAIERQIKWRRQTEDFVPEWKNFQTWINQRCWEEESAKEKPVAHQPAAEIKQVACVVCHRPAREYRFDSQHRPVWLCSDCCRAVGNKNWGKMSKGEIERAVEQGKRRPPPKDPELVESDKKQRTLAAMAKDLGDNMKAQ